MGAPTQRTAQGDFLNEALRRPSPPRVVLLCPEDPGAPWFRPQLLEPWHRVRSWPADSFLFTFHSGTAFSSGPKTDVPYLLLQSWEPLRRKRKREEIIVPVGRCSPALLLSLGIGGKLCSGSGFFLAAPVFRWSFYASNQESLFVLLPFARAPSSNGFRGSAGSYRRGSRAKRRHYDGN